MKIKSEIERDFFVCYFLIFKKRSEFNFNIVILVNFIIEVNAKIFDDI